MSLIWRREEDQVWGYDNIWPHDKAFQNWRYRELRVLRLLSIAYKSCFIAAAILIVFAIAMSIFALTKSAHAQAGVAETVSLVTTSNASGAGSCTGGGCTATNVATIKVNQYRKSLTFDNTGGVIDVGFCFGTCTASIGTGGTQTLRAGTNAFWPAGSAPNAAIVFIAASGTPVITVREGK